MKVIELTHGKVAIVDDEDFDTIAQYRWHYAVCGYAMRNTPMVNWVRGKMSYMHREIIKPPEGFEVDHINGNRLDNRRSNLRIATRQQNNWNRGANKNSLTGVKGVSMDRATGRFYARIGLNHKTIRLGCFDDVETAKAAYRAAEIKIAGEFVRKI